MKLEQLEYLIALSRFKSINIASKQLYRTPQAIGIALKKLEEELGCALLTSTHQGTSLTAKGWQLVQLTERFLADVGALRETPAGDALLTCSGSLVIHADYGSADFFFPRMIRMLYAQAPALSVAIDAMSYKEAVEQVRSGQITMAFFNQYWVNHTPKIDLGTDIHFFPLFQNQVVCRMANHLPLAAKQAVTLDDMLSYPLLVSLPNQKAESSIVPFLDDLHKPFQTYEVNGPSMMREFLSAGLGVALGLVLPGGNIDHLAYKDIRVVPVIDGIDVSFGYIIKGAEASAPDNLLISFIRGHLSELLKG